MARVDRAELSGIEGFHRPIALKRMLPHVATNDDMVKAFVREARLASHLRHANVAQTYELGKVDDVYFIAMELVTGPTLRAVLKHCAQTTGPMPIPIALNILNQICDALDYAHNLCDETGQPLGIIHRDVSPSNIIVDEAGVTKLIDFGIAKASAAGLQTMSGTLKGKFGYMAPEYILGSIDARADLFAVGIIAHELLTNRPLFSVADDVETMRRVRTMPLQPPSHKNPNVPAEIDGIVMTALSRDPDRRWQHATALRAALTTLTKRLGLVCTNRQVVEWISWMFEQTKPHGTKVPAAPAPDTTSTEPSVLIEQPTEPESPHSGSAAASQHLTVVASGRRDLPMAEGTPARSITAPPSLSTAEPHQAGGEHRAPVAAYDRHEGVAPAPRNTDEIRTALLRPSAPRIEQPAAPPPPAALPGGPTEPPSRIYGDFPRSSADHNVTLLDGAAALRSRPSSQAIAPAPRGLLGSQPPQAPPPQVPTLLGSQPPRALRPSQPPATPSSPPQQAAAAPQAPAPDPAPRRRRGAVWGVVLVLLAAGLAAAGVYLVL
jgi:eukaryotic-like serine/threonine-protein kinase